MKKFVTALCILLVVAAFVTTHVVMISRLGRDVREIGGRIEEAYRNEDWEGVQNDLEALQDRWDKSRLWASMTIKTDKLEEIEISLRQSKEYAQTQAKEDFIGEFIMFQMLVDHLPHQEGVSLEEIL